VAAHDDFLTVTEMEIVRGKPATGFPVLMVLDEFAGLKRMEVIEHAVAQIGGQWREIVFRAAKPGAVEGGLQENWEHSFPIRG